LTNTATSRRRVTLLKVIAPRLLAQLLALDRCTARRGRGTVEHPHEPTRAGAAGMRQREFVEEV